jgi:hypothetical protein
VFYKKKRVSIVKFFDKQQHHFWLLINETEAQESSALKRDFRISKQKITMMTNPGLVNAE